MTSFILCFINNLSLAGIEDNSEAINWPNISSSGLYFQVGFESVWSCFLLNFGQYFLVMCSLPSFWDFVPFFVEQLFGAYIFFCFLIAFQGAFVIEKLIIRSVYHVLFNFLIHPGLELSLVYFYYHPSSLF